MVKLEGFCPSIKCQLASATFILIIISHFISCIQTFSLIMAPSCLPVIHVHLFTEGKGTKCFSKNAREYFGLTPLTVRSADTDRVGSLECERPYLS